jgi:ABC-2 type transport system ATP-binding protein
MSNKIAISVESLEKKFGEKTAVSSISFQVQKGEIFGLLGPNGAGKTTTISMLTGLISPDKGTISINGAPFDRANNCLKREIGVVPQSLAIYPTLTARDNLNFFGRIYGLTGRKLKERIDKVLEIVMLKDRADDIVEQFSGGMKRRLNLAVALIHEPQILFLDEPTVGVDPQSRNAIFETIQSLKSLTIIYTTHYMEEAERLCQRVAIMDAGKIIALDTPSELCNIVAAGFFRAGISQVDMNPAFIDSLSTIPSINKIDVKDSVLEIEAHPLQESLVKFMDMVNKQGVHLSSLNVFESNLESVFLKLTGKTIRDN